MTNSTAPNTAKTSAAEEAPEGFELNVALLEVGDPVGLTNLTDDGCGATCNGSCASAVA